MNHIINFRRYQIKREWCRFTGSSIECNDNELEIGLDEIEVHQCEEMLSTWYQYNELKDSSYLSSN